MVGVALLKYFIGFPFELTLVCKMQFHQHLGHLMYISGLGFLTYNEGRAGTLEVLVVYVLNAARSVVCGMVHVPGSQGERHSCLRTVMEPLFCGQHYLGRVPKDW